MKKIITAILMLLSITAYSQSGYEFYEINFEDTSQFFRIQIDTISNPANIWEIGVPQKTIFDSALSIPNAIVTDLSNPYPVNDTSSFVIKHVSSGLGGFQMPHTVSISGYYKVNSDTLTDFGTIEFSPDNGITWVNLLTDTVYYNQYCYEWWSIRPVFTGISDDWTFFFVWVAGFGPPFNIQPGDTVLYRFTFISDSIQTNRDGLMFDDFSFQDYAEGINEIRNQFSSQVQPNPVIDKARIEFENKNDEIELVLFDNKGTSIIFRKKTTSDNFEIDLKNFPSGNYFYKLTDKKTRKISAGKIIKI